MAQDPKSIYLVVTPFFPSPARWQGAYVLDQVKAIKRHSRFDVVVFKTHPIGDAEHDYEIEGISVHCFRPPLMPSYFLNGLTGGPRGGLLGRLFVARLRRLGIDPRRVAYVHCHTANHASFGLGIRRVNPGARVIVQFHDPDPFTLRNGLWAGKRWNRRFRARRSLETLSRADLLLCISDHVRDVLLSFPAPREHEVFEPAIAMMRDVAALPALNARDIYVLGNGVDTTMFRPGEARTDGLFRIGCIANFVDWKNHIMLVKAFKMLIDKGYRDMRLSLLGSGPTRAEIERYIADGGLSPFVEWPAEVHHDQLPDYYRTLSLFALPSRYEGFGCVYTEAWACGVPFICCEHQGVSAYVDPSQSDRWLVRDGDIAGLAHLIERQYLHPARQLLCRDIDIDLLIPPFLAHLKTL